MHARSLLTFLFLCVAMVLPAQAWEPATQVTLTPKQAAALNALSAETLADAGFVISNGPVLRPADGYNLAVHEGLIVVVGGNIDYSAAKIPLGSIIVIRDSDGGGTLNLCGGTTCSDCQFFQDTETMEITCGGCDSCSSSGRSF